MNDIWIFGAGRFGRIALDRLHRRRPGARFMVADDSRDALNTLEAASLLPQGSLRLVWEDGPSFLARRFPADPDMISPGENRAPGWIVPAVPVHLAAEWLLKSASGSVSFRRINPPADLMSRLPGGMKGPSGDLYASLAAGICPDDCAEPAAYCPSTGRSRTANLFDLLPGIAVPGHEWIILRSRQLAPGVGGLLPADLFSLCQDPSPVSPSRILLATSCRCHGVVTVLEKISLKMA